MRVSERKPLYSVNIVTPDRVGRQGGTAFSGKPEELLALVPRRPDTPSACPAALAGYGVNCGTRYGHGFLEQVIGVVL